MAGGGSPRYPYLSANVVDVASLPHAVDLKRFRLTAGNVGKNPAYGLTCPGAEVNVSIRGSKVRAIFFAKFNPLLNFNGRRFGRR